MEPYVTQESLEQSARRLLPRLSGILSCRRHGISQRGDAFSKPGESRVWVCVRDDRR